MKKLIFEDYSILADIMYERAMNEECSYAVLFFDDAAELTKELMKLDSVSIGGIEISTEDYDGYCKEYYVSLDSDFIIDVQPAYKEKNEYREAGYLWFEGENVFIHSDCNSIIIKDIDKDNCYEIDFGTPIDDDEEDYDDTDKVIDRLLDNATIIEDEDGEPIGIGIDFISFLRAIFNE